MRGGQAQQEPRMVIDHRHLLGLLGSVKLKNHGMGRCLGKGFPSPENGDLGVNPDIKKKIC